MRIQALARFRGHIGCSCLAWAGLFVAILIVAMSSTSSAGMLDQAELRIRLKKTFPGSPETSATFTAATPSGYALSPTSVSLLPSTDIVGRQAISFPGTQGHFLTVDENQGGHFSGAPLAGAGSLTAHVCPTFPDFTQICSFTEPFLLGGATEPFTRVGFSATGGFPVTVFGSQQNFQTGQVFAGGTLTPAIVATGTNMLTASGNGQVTLVTPIRFSSPVSSYIGIGTLELHFVPEPAVGILLGWGAAFVAWQGFRRRRA